MTFINLNATIDVIRKQAEGMSVDDLRFARQLAGQMLRDQGKAESEVADHRAIRALDQLITERDDDIP